MPFPLVWGDDGKPRSATDEDQLDGAFSEVDTVPVSNATGSTLPKLTPVYKTATTTQVAPAQANSSTTHKVVGLMTEAVLTGNSGYAQTDGRITGSGAEWQAVGVGAGSGATPGTTIWLSADNPGEFVLDPEADIDVGEKLVQIGTFISATVLNLDIDYIGTK